MFKLYFFLSALSLPMSERTKSIANNDLGTFKCLYEKTMSIEIVIICSEMHFAMLTPSRVGGGEHPNLH